MCPLSWAVNPGIWNCRQGSIDFDVVINSQFTAITLCKYHYLMSENFCIMCRDKLTFGPRSCTCSLFISLFHWKWVSTWFTRKSVYGRDGYVLRPRVCTCVRQIGRAGPLAVLTIPCFARTWKVPPRLRPKIHCHIHLKYLKPAHGGHRVKGESARNVCLVA